MKRRRVAKRHHYLPQAYLAAFTDTGSKEGRFFVLEVHSGRSFTTSPKNVATEKGFNRVEVEGKPTDAIEQALAPFEQRATQAIQNVIASEDFPNDEDCNLILNLLGFIAVRNPQRRSSLNRTREMIMHQIADLLVSDKKIWDHYVRKARDAGEGIGGSVSFEDVKRFVEERSSRSSRGQV